jgi:hypothetical protein
VLAAHAAQWGLFDESPEILVRVGLRGGPGRIRTITLMNPIWTELSSEGSTAAGFGLLTATGQGGRTRSIKPPASACSSTPTPRKSVLKPDFSNPQEARGYRSNGIVVDPGRLIQANVLLLGTSQKVEVLHTGLAAICNCDDSCRGCDCECQILIDSPGNSAEWPSTGWRGRASRYAISRSSFEQSRITIAP